VRELLNPSDSSGVLSTKLLIDRWALGILAFEMLAGQLPFRGKTQLELFQVQIEYRVRELSFVLKKPRLIRCIALAFPEHHPMQAGISVVLVT
jgi:hypothetical protein